MQINEVVGQPGLLASIVAHPEAFVEKIKYAVRKLRAYWGEPIDTPSDWVEFTYYGAQEMLRQLRNGYMTIYRSIDVPDDWIPQSLGTHWSYDRSLAFAHYATNWDQVVLLEGQIAEKNIDIPVSIALTDLTEREVRARPGAPIRVVSIMRELNGQPALQHLIGKTFPA